VKLCTYRTYSKPSVNSRVLSEWSGKASTIIFTCQRIRLLIVLNILNWLDIGIILIDWIFVLG
jgi:hypothetical protein